MASTEAAREYRVPHWVRVRREDFGLLFYDIRSTALTFVRSGDSLSAPSFTGEHRVLGVAGADGKPSAAVERLLADLEGKGLVVADEAE